MKKNSSKFKVWIKNRNIKNLNRRTLKKIKKRSYLRSVNRNNTRIKKSEIYNIEENRIEFKTPNNFSIIDNSEETNSFFKKVLDFISIPKNFGKRIFIDISNISNLTVDALMYLLAIINNLNKNYEKKYRFSGNEPKNNEINKIFKESGFYKFVNYNGNEPIKQNKDNLQIISGEKSDPKLASVISDFVCNKANIENRKKVSFLYDMMIELMSNTYKHAYNQSDHVLYPRWYCFANYDNKKYINIIFMDTGEGIPATVQKNIAEKLDILKIIDEYKYVISALDSDFRTSTGLMYHGKGLPKIKKYCTESKICDMHIITNKANLQVNNNGYNGNDLINSIQGTLYSFKIDILSLKKEDI